MPKIMQVTQFYAQMVLGQFHHPAHDVKVKVH